MLDVTASLFVNSCVVKTPHHIKLKEMCLVVSILGAQANNMRSVGERQTKDSQFCPSLVIQST